MCALLVPNLIRRTKANNAPSCLLEICDLRSLSVALSKQSKTGRAYIVSFFKVSFKVIPQNV